jgi:hypothetical protein
MRGRRRRYLKVQKRRKWLLRAPQNRCEEEGVKEEARLESA